MLLYVALHVVEYPQALGSGHRALSAIIPEANSVLIRFSSVETESITMFGDVALQLIRMLGASGAVPGALYAENVPAAVQRLRQQLALESQDGSTPSGDTMEEDEQEGRELPIALRVRAQPLIDILERAAAVKVPVMWEAA